MEKLQIEESQDEVTLFDDQGLASRLREVLPQTFEATSKRLNVLKWAAGGLAALGAGVVVERVSHRYSH